MPCPLAPGRSPITPIDELNPGERQLWDAFTQGRPFDLRDDSSAAEPAVQAEVITALLLEADTDPAPGERPALRLTGARITGSSNLRFADIPLPVILDKCRFNEPPSLQGASIRELVGRLSDPCASV